MQESFTVTTHGKWILAGEHAVLRGCPALIFPVKSRFLRLSFTPAEHPLNIQFGADYPNTSTQLLYDLLDKARNMLHQPNLPHGDLLIENTIPISAGMGASAAISVAFAKWFANLRWITKEDVENFACQLENFFHGESSGADIAVIMRGHGIYYQRHQPVQTLQINWQPHWYLSHCGEQGVTSVCLDKVRELATKRSDFAEAIDQRMIASTEAARTALSLDNDQGLPLLQHAIQEARQCFESWQLVTPKLSAHMDNLIQQGALAVKPTGSGLGGFALSLWPSPAPKNLNLIDAN